MEGKMNKSDVRSMIDRLLGGEIIDEDLNYAIETIGPESDESVRMALHDMQHYIADKDLRIKDCDYELLLKENLVKSMNSLKE